MTPGFKLWYDAYVDCLAGLRLRNALRRARPGGPVTGSRAVVVEKSKMLAAPPTRALVIPNR